MTVWLPNAIYYGVPYELFWHLNPKKLEPFKAAKEIELEADRAKINFQSWLTGSYVGQAVSAVLSNGKSSYPEKPRDLETDSKATKGKPVTDADKFAAFAAKHNAQRKRLNNNM